MSTDDILNCYRILQLEPGASAKVAKKAYRELVKRWHPDRFQHDAKQKQDAEDKIKEINLAFERIQELQPSDLLAIRASQAGFQAGTGAGASAFQAKRNARPQRTTRSATHASPRPAPSPEFAQSVPKRRAWGLWPAQAWTRLVKPAPMLLALSVVTLCAVAVVFRVIRNSSDLSEDTSRDHTPSMSELDRMIDANRSRVPADSGAVAGSAASNPSLPAGLPVDWRRFLDAPAEHSRQTGLDRNAQQSSIPAQTRPAEQTKNIGAKLPEITTEATPNGDAASTERMARSGAGVPSASKTNGSIALPVLANQSKQIAVSGASNFTKAGTGSLIASKPDETIVVGRNSKTGSPPTNRVSSKRPLPAERAGYQIAE